MGKFIFGFIVGILVLIGCGYLYFSLGLAPAATSAAPMPFEKKFANMALRARIKSEAPNQAPFSADEPNLTAGAKVYVQNCAFCHGLPGQADSPAAAKGMFPAPPQLFDKDDMVTDDPVGSTFWKVDNGIRLTGMPGFNKSLTKNQVWQVSLLLAGADKLSPQTKAALVPIAVVTPPALSVPLKK
jgi:mono/diheme cytochrome c family protein